LRPIQGQFPDIIKRAAKTAPTLADAKGRSTVSAYDLRRSAITNWAERLPMQAVMTYVGHSTITTTARCYATTTADHKRRAREVATAALVAD
jgi:integrase